LTVAVIAMVPVITLQQELNLFVDHFSEKYIASNDVRIKIMKEVPLLQFLFLFEATEIICIIFFFI
jgi:hypothetical protein